MLVPSRNGGGIKVTLDEKPAQLNRTQAELLLAAVIVARSGSFLLSKIVLRRMTPLNLLSVRFVMAFALLAPIF